MKKNISSFLIIMFVISLININAFAADSNQNSDGEVIVYEKEYKESSSAVAPENDSIVDFSLTPADTSHLDKGITNTDANIIYPDGVTFRPTEEAGAVSSVNASIQSSYANYNGSNAAAYALTFAETPNSQYKKLDSDCTNFVSQAIAVGGVYSYIGNYGGVPSVFQDWIVDDNSNAWYMIKKTRPIGLDYWVYSKSWAFVDTFRTFHTARSASGSKTFYGKLSGGTPNTTPNVNTNFEYKLRKNASVGQVWQLTGRHSVIITAVSLKSNGYNYVWYSGHSNTAKNKDIQYFLDYCAGYPSTQIARMSFS